MTSDPRRTSIVQCARHWLNTPWHHAARARGSGIDCVQLINAVFHEAVATPLIEVDYAADQYLHRNREMLLECLAQFARPVPAALPGDIVTYRFGRAMSHGGIVVEWPQIIHASRPDRAVVLGHGDSGNLTLRERLYYRWNGFGD